MMQVIKSPAEYADRYEMGAMAGATNSVAGIKGAAALLHGVQGCTIETSHLRSGGPVVAGNYLPIMETNMGPMESVYGRNVPLIVERARELMRRRERPELLFIFTGCGPSIIEDDINRAAAIISEETETPVIALDTAAFLGGFARGAEMTWCAVLDRFGEETDSQKGINLLGPQLMGSNNWPNDIAEIERLLEAADVELNHVLFRNITVDQLPQISRAKVNYILSGEDFSDFEETAEDLGMSIWGQDLVLPVGIHNTEEWYLTVAREFGDEDKARVQINEDLGLVRKMTKLNYTASWMLTGMFGKHIAILGQAPFVAALARAAFYDFNMRPTVIGLLSETPEGLERAEKLLEPMSDFLDFEVLENPTFYSYGEKIKEAKVSFAVGTRIDRHMVEGLGIPHCSLTGPNFMNHWDLIPWPYFGVRGTLYLASEFWRVLDRVMTQPLLWQMNTYQPRDGQSTEEESG